MNLSKTVNLYHCLFSQKCDFDRLDLWFVLYFSGKYNILSQLNFIFISRFYTLKNNIIVNSYLGKEVNNVTVQSSNHMGSNLKN